MTISTILPPLFGGVLIGLASALLLLLNGRIAGISGIVDGVVHPSRGDVGWRAAFVIGLIAAGLLLPFMWPAALPDELPRSVAIMAVAGLVVGFGTRMGSGCTSGHGVCGLSRFSPRSLAAVLTFMGTGIVTVAAWNLIGGA